VQNDEGYEQAVSIIVEGIRKGINVIVHNGKLIII
jgi:hypothetical protein